jgi:hypothetical protein
MTPSITDPTLSWEILPHSKPASHIPLSWMVREAMKAGLSFDMDKVVSMGCCDALDSLDAQQQPQFFAPGPPPPQEPAVDAAAPRPALPTFRFDGGSQPTSPVIDNGIAPDGPAPDEESAKVEGVAHDLPEILSPTLNETPRSHFHSLIHRAHRARIHDSLAYGGGLGLFAVASWRLMEYLPFRRMVR